MTVTSYDGYLDASLDFLFRDELEDVPVTVRCEKCGVQMTRTTRGRQFGTTVLELRTAWNTRDGKQRRRRTRGHGKAAPHK